jgi:hypothetical protein
VAFEQSYAMIAFYPSIPVLCLFNLPEEVDPTLRQPHSSLQQPWLSNDTGNVRQKIFTGMSEEFGWFGANSGHVGQDVTPCFRAELVTTKAERVRALTSLRVFEPSLPRRVIYRT